MALRSYQHDGCKAIFQALMRGVKMPIAVMATGTGKSVVIAELLKGLMHFPKVRAIMLVDSKELVEQNVKALTRMWPQGIHEIGVNQADLGRRDTRQRIVMAGIQSVFRKAASFGQRTHVFVDEAHMIPEKGEGMYRQFLDGLRKVNPDIQIVKFTATPYRMGTGTIEGEVVYDYPIAQGIEEGWLAPLASKRTVLKYDLKKVKKAGGEFVEKDLQQAIDQEDVTLAAVAEMIEFASTYHRKSWLVFATGVEHAMHVRDAVRAAGYTSEVVTGDTPKIEREQILERFKRGEITCLTNANVLTKGFDAPGVDLIAFMRPTLSTSLYVQMIGRGTRVVWGDFNPDEHDNEGRRAYIATSVKPSCIVLDFAGNIRRHGPVDMIDVEGRTKGKGAKEEKTEEKTVRAKECKNPDCDALLRLDCFECPDCGFAWEPTPKEVAIQAKADGESAVMSTEITANWLQVHDRFFSRNYGKEQPDGTFKIDTLKVEYVCGHNATYREWVTVLHQVGQARARAAAWWAAMGGEASTLPNDETLMAEHCIASLATVTHVMVRPDTYTTDTGKKKTWRVARYRLRDKAGEEWEVDDLMQRHIAQPLPEEEDPDPPLVGTREPPEASPVASAMDEFLQREGLDGPARRKVYGDKGYEGMVPDDMEIPI